MGDPSVRTGAPVVRLLGRGGVGRSVLGSALRRRGVETSEGGPADATVYCFAGGLRATDRSAIAALSDGPLLVVWCRADAAGSWRAADAYAERLGAVLGRTVIPVMALLDDPDVDPDAVRRLAGSALALPESVTEAAVVLGDDAALLDRIGAYGLACAIGALRETPSMSDDELRYRLRELGGVDALLEPLGAAIEGCAARREAEFEDELRTVALTDCARRDRAEQLLLDRLGWAS